MDKQAAQSAKWQILFAAALFATAFCIAFSMRLESLANVAKIDFFIIAKIAMRAVLNASGIVEYAFNQPQLYVIKLIKNSAIWGAVCGFIASSFVYFALSFASRSWSNRRAIKAPDNLKKDNYELAMSYFVYPVVLGFGVYFTANLFEISPKFGSLLSFAGSVWLAGAFLITYKFVAFDFFGADQTGLKEGKEILNGVQEIPTSSLINKVRELPSRINIGGVPIPTDLETRHFLVPGTTGAGKSVLFTSWIKQVLAANAKAIIVDPNCGYTAKFYNKDRDFIMNSLDARFANWSPLAEIERKPEVDAFAAALLPMGENESGASKFFIGSSRNLLAAIIMYLMKLPPEKATNGELLRLLFDGTPEELKEITSGTDAASLFAGKPGETLQGVRMTLSEKAAALKTLNPAAGRDSFSITKWIRDDNQKGIIFLSYKQNDLDALKPLYSIMLNAACKATVNLSECPTRRIWLIVDEFSLLPRINAIGDFATNARKNGGCLVLAMQSASQIDATYGKDEAASILSCCTSVICFNPGETDFDTAERASKMLGEADLRITTKSGSTSDGRQTFSWQQRDEKQPAISTAKLKSLANNTGYIKLRLLSPAKFVQDPKKIMFADITDGYIEADGLRFASPEPAPAQIVEAVAEPEPDIDLLDTSSTSGIDLLSDSGDPNALLDTPF